MKRFCVILVLFIMLSCGYSSLPPQVKPCPRQSPSFAECIKDAIDILRPSLKSGNIATGFTVEGIDPLLIGEIKVSQGFDLHLSAFTAFGLSDFKIDKIRASYEKLKIEAVLMVPEITTKSPYTLSWKLALSNLQGSGEATAHLDNVRIVLKLTLSRYLKDDVSFVKVDELKISIKPEGLRVHFSNLFNGQKALENIGNEVINQNIDILKNNILPQVESGLSNKFLRTANQIFEKAPESEFFP